MPNTVDTIALGKMFLEELHTSIHGTDKLFARVHVCFAIEPCYKTVSTYSKLGIPGLLLSDRNYAGNIQIRSI